MLERGRVIAERVRVSKEEFSDSGESADDFILALKELSEASPELFASDLDTMYVREVVAAVPQYVARTLQLSGLPAGRKPKEVVGRYLSEAVRSYVFGFPLAAIALSRAALEQAIKECMTGPPVGTSLKDKIDQVVEQLGLDHATARLAMDVATAGNNVLHQRPVRLTEAFDVLIKMRKFLEALYASDASE